MTAKVRKKSDISVRKTRLNHEFSQFNFFPAIFSLTLPLKPTNRTHQLYLHQRLSATIYMSSSEIFHNITHNNNMGVVRYILCIIVILLHTAVLTGVYLPGMTYGHYAVGGFFALSGFLLFASFQRSPTTKHYFLRRARRILPPYFLIVLICAFGFVSISSLNWIDYYTDGGFWQYLTANISFMNFIHNELPGVFQGDKFLFPTINGSLWTMKGEWVCYSLIPIIYRLISNNNRRAIYLFTAIIILCMSIHYSFYELEDYTGNKIFGIIGKQFGNLYVYFYCGALINIFYSQFLKYKWWVLGGIITIFVIGDYNPFYYVVFLPIALSMLVIWVSQMGKWGTFLKNHDDLSYDMYLFHFPIIQLTNYWGWPNKMHPYALLLVVIGISFVTAIVSWNILGKHILHRKKS